VTASQHSIDLLIRELIASGRAATEAEIAAIVDRMASAPFDPRVVHVGRKYRGLQYQGRALSNREQALFFHLTLRVVYDEQWRTGTTEQDYVEDLRSAIRDPAAHLLVYERRGGSIAAILAQNNIALERRGPEALPLLYVVYSVDRSTIASGYQASAIGAISIPGDARWLR
jgi:hypothetical protein